MRTTVEIPDPLFKTAKKYCFESGITLRELITNGIRRELEDANAQSPARVSSDVKLPLLPTKKRKPYKLSAEEIDRILVAEEIGTYGSTGRSYFDKFPELSLEALQA